MRIAFFASGISPHVSGICDELYQRLGEDFAFFATEKDIRHSIVVMGAGNLHLTKPYYRNTGQSKQAEKEAIAWAREADVAIVGCSNCYSYIEERFNHGDKLTLKLKERLFKDGNPTHVEPPLKNKIDRCYRSYLNKNLYYLTAGAYAPYDFITIGVPKEKLIRWGYFPEVSSSPIRKTAQDYLGTIKLIWVGRFVREKLYMNVIHAVEELKTRGLDVHLDVVGYGEGEVQVAEYVDKNSLDNLITLHGPTNESGIRILLRQNHFFLMTSNYEEGWGAVLNEAMSEGCIPVSSLATGATGELMEDGRCGSYFLHEHPEDLVDQIIQLAQNRNSLPAMSSAAIRQINELWNSKIAAERLLDWIDAWMANRPPKQYLTGPCAVVRIYENELDLAAALAKTRAAINEKV